MKKVLLPLLVMFGLGTNVYAENSSATPASHSFAIGAAEDYGFGLTMQFGRVLDVSVGHAGAGADFIIMRYPFMPGSKFFAKRPLNFYVGAGGGYVWDNGYAGIKKGIIARAPIGVDWTFHRHWSVYGSASPALNFKEESGTSFVVMGTIGVRYLF